MYKIGDWVRPSPAVQPHTIQWELWPKRIVDAMTDPDNLESTFYVDGVGWFEQDELVSAKC